MEERPPGRESRASARWGATGVRDASRSEAAERPVAKTRCRRDRPLGDSCHHAVHDFRGITTDFGSADLIPLKSNRKPTLNALKFSHSVSDYLTGRCVHAIEAGHECFCSPGEGACHEALRPHPHSNVDLGVPVRLTTGPVHAVALNRVGP